MPNVAVYSLRHENRPSLALWLELLVSEHINSQQDSIKTNLDCRTRFLKLQDLKRKRVLLLESIT